jgi:hypothetical protein
MLECDENLPKQDGRIQVQAQKEKPPTKVDCKGNMNKSSIEPLLLSSSPKSQGAYQIKRREQYLIKHLT